MKYDDLENEKQNAVEYLLSLGYVVEVKSTRNIVVYLKEHDDPITFGAAQPYKISQVHPLEKDDSPFGTRVVLAIYE